MRVCLLFALLLLSYSSVAQTSSPSELKKTFPPDQRSQTNEYLISSVRDQLQAGQKPFKPDLARCFFIRSYNFERQGTAAPVLKNVTTCTPAKSDPFRQTGTPKAKLIPAS
ncbi:MAG TPA: hypothetical protein VF493_11980 [Terriglobales bacterium]